MPLCAKFCRTRSEKSLNYISQSPLCDGFKLRSADLRLCWEIKNQKGKINVLTWTPITEVDTGSWWRSKNSDRSKNNSSVVQTLKGQYSQ